MTTWLAIERTEEGDELLHGVSPDLEELQLRVLKVITTTTMQNEVSQEEHEQITAAIMERAPEVSEHLNAASVERLQQRSQMMDAVAVAVIGRARTSRIYKRIATRAARVSYERR